MYALNQRRLLRVKKYRVSDFQLAVWSVIRSGLHHITLNSSNGSVNCVLDHHVQRTVASAHLKNDLAI